MPHMSSRGGFHQQSFIDIDNIYKPALTQATFWKLLSIYSIPVCDRTFTLQDNACECSKELWNLVCGS